MPTLEARGVEIAWGERGEGPAVLLVHETAATGSVWDEVAAALAGEARAISYDRRGWGDSGSPQEYLRTTVEEQSEDAAALLESADAAPAVIAGAGVGAMVALDLLLRRPDLIAEMGVSTGWRMPLPRLASAEHPSVIVTAPSTPPLLRDASSALVERLQGASAREVDSGPAPPHIGAAEEVGALALELSR